MTLSSLGLCPGRWYYGLAVLVAVAGIALSISTMISAISSLGSEMQQIVVPGESDLQLIDVGEYTVFYENQTVVDGRIYSTDENISGLRIEVKNKTTGIKVASYSPKGSFSYSFGDRTGRSVLAFNIEQPGIYQLSAEYPEGTNGPQVVLAVGHGLAGSLVSGIMLPMMLFFGSIAAAAIIVIVTYLKRHEAAKRADEEERLIKGL